MRDNRTQLYRVAKEQLGEEGLQIFMAEVRDYWAAERERLRKARLVEHAAGMASARERLK